MKLCIENGLSTRVEKVVLPPFEIIDRFGFSRLIDIIMHLDIDYI